MRIEAYNSTNQNFKGYIDSSVYKIAQKQENKLAKLIEQGRITKVSGIEKKLEIKNAINKLKIYAKQLHPQTKITAKELSQTSSGAVENFIEIQAQNKKLNITHPLGKTETFQTQNTLNLGQLLNQTIDKLFSQTAPEEINQTMFKNKTNLFLTQAKTKRNNFINRLILTHQAQKYDKIAPEFDSYRTILISLKSENK